MASGQSTSSSIGAFAQTTKPTAVNLEEEEDDEDSLCAVCLQTCVHPVQLTCRHVFCFLCVKGVAIQSKRCPMCRREIPANYLENPKLITPLEDLPGAASPADADQGWYYEGRNGWWQYDGRTSAELENHHKRGDKACELLIAGFLYTVDLEQMLQCRRNDPNRRRRIKRDVSSIPKKGIAGLRVAVPPPPVAAASAPAASPAAIPALPADRRQQQQQQATSAAAMRSLEDQMLRDLTLQDQGEVNDAETNEEVDFDGGRRSIERGGDDDANVTSHRPAGGAAAFAAVAGPGGGVGPADVSRRLAVRVPNLRRRERRLSQ